MQITRFAIMTSLVVATVLLLGFSIYLAGVLGFIPSFWAKIPVMPIVQAVSVPLFVGHTYSDANKLAKGNGLTLSTSPNATDPTKCVVVQDPVAGRLTSTSSPIEVKLGVCPATSTKGPTLTSFVTP